jgi:hypothetical protein
LDKIKEISFSHIKHKGLAFTEDGVMDISQIPGLKETGWKPPVSSSDGMCVFGFFSVLFVISQIPGERKPPPILLMVCVFFGFFFRFFLLLVWECALCMYVCLLYVFVCCVFVH